MVCDIIDYGLWCHMPDLWCHRCFSSHMISHTMSYDITYHVLWCHRPFCHTYDIIWHGMWYHMWHTHLVTYDVTDISHAYDVTYHDLWCHIMVLIWRHIWRHIPICHNDNFIHDGSTLPSRRLFLVSAPFSLLSLILFCRMSSVSATDIGRGNDLP